MSFKDGGTAAVQALLAGEIQFRHLSPAVRESLPDSAPPTASRSEKFIEVGFVKAR
jgi:hypothetical protein